MSNDDKVVCPECDWHGTLSQMPVARNPFDPEHEMTGCPDCKMPVNAYLACYASGCWRMASCGTPTPDGYVSSCYEHRPKD